MGGERWDRQASLSFGSRIQAHLSLPANQLTRYDFQDRSDIWLEKPNVTVNFEVLRENRL